MRRCRFRKRQVGRVITASKGDLSMSIAGFGRIRGDVDHPDAVPAPPKSGSAGGLTAFIAQGCEFDGKLRVKGSLRIDGDFRGEIFSEDTVVVGETAGVEANVQSKTVVVSGALAGNVVASRQLVLHKNGRLQGSVETPCLSVEPGAVFNGRTKMVRPEVLLRAQATQEAEVDAAARTDSPAAEQPKAAAPRAARGTGPTPVRPEVSAG
jgi:cytoskeletal protein CcmA (bactofilin family)